MSSPFRKPSEAPAPQDGKTEMANYEGALCIFTLRKHDVIETKYSKDKSIVDVDIDVVEGVKAGTVSKMPPREFGATPRVLEDLTGEHADNVRVFAGWIVGAFNSMQKGGMVLGRIEVQGKEYEGKNQPTWVLTDATEAEITKAAEYLTKRNASQFGAGAPAQPIPAQPGDQEPDF